MSREVQQLFDTVTTLYKHAPPFDGVVVRSVAIKYANKHDFFSGAGASISGGRWNPVGIPASYASLDVRTAVEEAYQNFTTFGFSLSSIQPRVIAGAKISLHTTLDLTSSKVRSLLGFSKTELRSEEWRAIQRSGEESWTQTIGRAGYMAGFEGIIAPSARSTNGKNAVVFPDNLNNPGQQIVILSPDQLPK